MVAGMMMVVVGAELLKVEREGSCRGSVVMITEVWW